jgi:WD40 repeat protein
MGTSCLAIAPDGATLAWVAGGEHVIRLWDIAAGGEIRSQPGHRSAIGDAAFTPDGKTLVTVAVDRTLRYWDPETGVETRRIEASDDSVRFDALSADGKTVETGGVFQPSRLWDLSSGRELRRFFIPGEHIVSRGDLSADGQTLATSENDGVMLWNTATGQRRECKAKSKIPPALVAALRFAPDGKSVATIGGDWVRFWDVATAKEVRRITIPNAPAWRAGEPRRPGIDVMQMIGAGLAFSPDGEILAASSQRDGLIILLAVASGSELARLDGPENRLKAVAFSPDGRMLATGVDISDRHHQSHRRPHRRGVHGFER